MRSRLYNVNRVFHVAYYMCKLATVQIERMC